MATLSLYMFGPLVLSPGAALVRAQQMGNQQQQSYGDAGDLIENFMNAFDATEWTLILHVCLMAISLSVSMVCGICICFLRPCPTPVYYVCNISSIFFAFSLVFLLEPRVSHWLPSLERITSAGRTLNPAEWRTRLKNWWNWRQKYARQQRTKLNV